MSEHYVCTGSCKGFSEMPGKCQASDCDKSGEELANCNCEDNLHSEVLN